MPPYVEQMQDESWLVNIEHEHPNRKGTYTFEYAASKDGTLIEAKCKEGLAKPPPSHDSPIPIPAWFKEASKQPQIKQGP